MDARKSKRRAALTPLLVLARAHRVRTSRLLPTARALGVELLHDKSGRRLAAVSIADEKIGVLLEHLRRSRGTERKTG